MHRHPPTVFLLSLAIGLTWLAVPAEAQPIEPLPFFYEPEHRYAYTGNLSPAGYHVEAQGSVDVSFYQMGGMPQDELAILWDVHLLVGPYWYDVSSVVPTVTVDGFKNWNADQDDVQGWEISNLTWDIVGGLGPNGTLSRIRLKFQVAINGDYSQLTRLGYSFFARGRRLGPDGVGEPGPVKPQGGLG